VGIKSVYRLITACMTIETKSSQISSPLSELIKFSQETHESILSGINYHRVGRSSKINQTASPVSRVSPVKNRNDMILHIVILPWRLLPFAIYVEFHACVRVSHLLLNFNTFLY
jgi:hypothetical protein